MSSTPPRGHESAVDVLAGILPSWSLTLLAWIAVLVPAAAVLVYVAAFAVNGPHFDHLTTAEIFDRWDTGQFTLEYIFRQYNEHRKAVPRLAQLGLGLITRNSNRAEMFLQWALLCTTAIVLFAAFRQDIRASAVRALLAFAPVSALLLSVRQYEILLVGDGMLTYLSLVFFATSLWLLWRDGQGTASFAGAVVAALGTTFSQSNGLLIWPIGLLVLLSDARLHLLRKPVLRIGVWSAVAAAAIAFYFYGYITPPKPGIAEVLRHTTVVGTYFLAVCGTSLSPDMRGAVAAGLLVVALELVVVLMVLRDWWRDGRRPPFGIWLVICAVASITMIALNRGWIGIGQALTPRYSTYSSLAPIGLYWCARARRDAWRLGPSLTTALATIVTFGVVAGSLDGWVAGPRQRDWHRWHGYLIYTWKNQPASLIESDLYPNVAHARVYTQTLERLGLNVFAEDHIRPRDVTVINARAEFAVAAISPAPPAGSRRIEVEGDEPVIVSGWAVDGGTGRPAAAVFINIDGAEDLPALAGLASPERPGPSGFKGSFSAALLAPGVHQIALTIVQADGTHAVRTEPFLEIVRR